MRLTRFFDLTTMKILWCCCFERILFVVNFRLMSATISCYYLRTYAADTTIVSIDLTILLTIRRRLKLNRIYDFVSSVPISIVSITDYLPLYLLMLNATLFLGLNNDHVIPTLLVTLREEDNFHRLLPLSHYLLTCRQLLKRYLHPQAHLRVLWF